MREELTGNERAFKIGVVLPTFCGGEASIPAPPLSELVEYAEAAERLGLDSVWVVEHVLEGSPKYRCTWLEPISAISFIAARTNRVKIGTSVLLLPLRNPVILAKTLATVDHLSNGRLIVGAGAGWVRREFEAVGVSFSKRGAILDEQLRVLRDLLDEENVSRKDSARAHEIVIEPRPANRRHLPIWVGGGLSVEAKSDRIFRRVARFGDGWIARPTGDIASMQRAWLEIGRHAREMNHDPSSLTFAQLNFVLLGDETKVQKSFSPIVSMPLGDIKRDYIVGGRDEIIQRLNALAGIGMNYLVAWTAGFDYETLEFLGNEVLPLFTKR